MTGAIKLSVAGRDVTTDCYRVRSDAGLALVPESLMAGLTPGERPSHEQAYRWIARNEAGLARAITRLAQGQKPKAPFDLVTLAKET